MLALTRSPRVLIATDFDETLFESYRLNPLVFRGGWLLNRVPWDTERLISALNQNRIEILIVEVEQVPERIFVECPNLMVVASLRANPVNVDLDAAMGQGVIVLYAPGRNAQAVAELALCLMIDAMRSVSRAIHEMRSGCWGEGQEDPYLRFRGEELADKTVGLLGFGAIGQRLARILSGFDVTILACDPFQPSYLFDQYGVTQIGIDELLQRAEVLSIHVPLNPSTKGMLDERALRQLRRGVILINTARAEIIERDALIDALADGRIAFAAMDVHYKEPVPKDDPLLKMPNTLLTPHLGGATRQVVSNGSRMIAEDLDRILSGHKPYRAAALPRSPRFRVDMGRTSVGGGRA